MIIFDMRLGSLDLIVIKNPHGSALTSFVECFRTGNELQFFIGRYELLIYGLPNRPTGKTPEQRPAA